MVTLSGCEELFNVSEYDGLLKINDVISNCILSTMLLGMTGLHEKDPVRASLGPVGVAPS